MSSVAAAKPLISDLRRRISEIGSLPQVALRVMEVANDPNSTAADLKAVMEVDPALSARVLRCVNSSAYGTRVRITNLQHAIAFLGVKQIRNLAMTAGVAKMFDAAEQIGAYQRRSLWKHMVAVGICARMIAMRLRFQEFEDVFVAGLLHDIGIVLEDQHVHALFEKAMLDPAPDEPLSSIEQKHLGFDHCTLGKAVGSDWKFPSVVIESVAHHHDSSKATEAHRAVVRFVEVANSIVSLRGMTSVGVQRVRFPKEVFLEMGLTKDDVLVLAADLDREMAGNASLFEL